MERKSNLLKIISKYKPRHQLKKLAEEVFEFQESVIDYDNSKDSDLVQKHYHLTEEYADIMVLLMQFKLFYGIKDDEVNDFIDQKVERQIHRMEKEKDNG